MIQWIMPFKIKVAANTLVQLIGRSISAVTTFIIMILLAAAYGPIGFGEFIKMTTYIGFFYLIADFGINAIYLKEEKSGSVRFSNLLFLRALWAILLTFAAIAILVFLPFDTITNQGFTPLVKLGIIILAPTILFQAIFVSCNALFQKHLRYDKSVIATIVSTALTLVLVYLLVSMHAPLTVTLGAFVFGASVLTVVSLGLSRPYVDGRRLLQELLTNNNIKVWKNLVRQSYPLGLTLVFNLIYFRADIFILSYLRTTVEVGIYGLAYKFFDFSLTIPVFFMNAVYPALLARASNPPAFIRIIKQSAVFLFIASVVVLITGYMVSPLLTMVKPDFVLSILPFRILLGSVPFFFLSSLFMWALIAAGKQRKLPGIYSLGMILNIVLNLLIVPVAGYNGAAVITGISEAFVLALLFVTFQKLYTFPRQVK